MELEIFIKSIKELIPIRHKGENALCIIVESDPECIADAISEMNHDKKVEIFKHLGSNDYHLLKNVVESCEA